MGLSVNADINPIQFLALAMETLLTRCTAALRARLSKEGLDHSEVTPINPTATVPYSTMASALNRGT
jgi:hypothetical protein